MVNYKIQTKSGQCGIHNLANIMRNRSIIDTYGDKEAYAPTGTHEANKILKLEGYKWSIEPLIMPASWRLKIPFGYFKQVLNHLITANPDISNHFMSFILFVHNGDGLEFGLHAISLISHKGRFAISDPLNASFEIIDNLDSIRDKYKYVNAVSSFMNRDGEFVSFTHEFYGHTELFN
jgi:hypothetical protein